MSGRTDRTAPRAGICTKGQIFGAYAKPLQLKDLVPDMHYMHQRIRKLSYAPSIWDFPDSLVHIVHILSQVVGREGLSICTKDLGIGAYADRRKEGNDGQDSR